MLLAVSGEPSDAKAFDCPASTFFTSTPQQLGVYPLWIYVNPLSLVRGSFLR